MKCKKIGHLKHISKDVLYSFCNLESKFKFENISLHGYNNQYRHPFKLYSIACSP